MAFARYYLLVNSKNYFIPPLEKLEIYNLGEDSMWVEGQYWLSYSSPRVWSISKELQGTVLGLFPAFFLVLNIYYAILCLPLHPPWRLPQDQSKIGMLATFGTITSFLIINAAFSIFANIVVIRYEIFPMLIFLAFAMLLTDYVGNPAPSPKPNPAKKSSPNQAISKLYPNG